MPESPENLRERKSALRKEVLHQREALTEEERSAASAEILRKIRALDEYRRAEVVLAYSGFGTELDTETFLRCVLEDGKTLVLPRVVREKKSLALHAVSDLDNDLEPGVWGIREPGAHLLPVSLAEVDFALVPGVAFDARGGRLGHGAGFYDRLLGASTKRPNLVAGAFEAQMVGEVPVTEHDVPVDRIITEKASYPRTPRRHTRSG